MKKWIVSASLVFLSLVLKAKTAVDTLEPNAESTKIDLVYNHYIQDGNNSAITGGEGTEELTVYGPSAIITYRNEKIQRSLKLGADVISSASTDNIDFINSSASILDSRMYLEPSFGRIIPKINCSIEGGGGVSVESDYYSLHANLRLNRFSWDQRKSTWFQFRYFDDDLRWGRITKTIYEPRQLIFPKELRGDVNFLTFKRYSYHFLMGQNYIVNPRNLISYELGITWQQGILSTPFHRVYRVDTTVDIERLPSSRFKMTMAGQWNTFLGNKTVMKNYLSAYGDSFGVRATAIENKMIYKSSLNWSFVSVIRLSVQSGSRYFAEKGMHAVDSEFYTSDYDLSGFQSYTLGGGFRVYPFWMTNESLFTDQIEIMYAYYRRSNGLYGHHLTAAFQFRVQKQKTTQINE